MKIYKYHLGEIHSIEVKDDVDNKDFYITADEKTAPLQFWCLKKFRKTDWPTTKSGAIINRIIYFKSLIDELEKKKTPYYKKITAMRRMLTKKDPA